MKEKFKIKNKTCNQSGFTLMETIMTIFIFSIIMLGTSLLLKDILVNIRQQYGVIDNVDQARRTADNFVKELRNITYGINGAYPISQASDTQVIFFSTAIKNNGTVTKVRYYVLNNTLYKGTIDPGSSASPYSGQETITTLSTKMSLGSNPLFYYYDGNYNGEGSPLSQPVNLNQIKFIKINLIVLKELTASSNTTFTVSAGSSMRNLKDNLGN